MATLHVRNVPDPLYDALRAAAADNGRSIGAETVDVLYGGLFGRGRRFPRPGGRRPIGRAAFDPAARLTIAQAQEAARELGHDHVRTEHVLLALAADAELGPLIERGIDAEALRERVVARVGRGDTPSEGTLPFGPDTKQALELALRESLRTHSRCIRTRHLLLGLLGAEGVAAEILGELGVTAEAVRVESYRPPAVHVREAAEFRVIELAGSSDDWERQLNEAAGDGFELEQIVGARAIFRGE